MGSSIRRLFEKRRLDRGLDDELAFHLEMRTRRNIEAGMPPEEARAAALKQFGGVLRTEEACREARGFVFLETLARDLRFGLRALRKSPGFTLASVALLALGIGANTAIFSVVNGVLLKPLPYKDPDRLVRMYGTYKGAGAFPLSDANFFDYRAQSQSFDAIAAWTDRQANLTGGDEPERILAASVTANFFDVLGAAPLRGRTFVGGEDQAGRDGVAVLSHELWQRRFGSDPAVLGRTIALDGRSVVVVGVLPPSFRFPEYAELWLPTTYDPSMREATRLQPFARLKRGVTFARANAEAARIAAALARAYPAANAEIGISITTLHDSLVGQVRRVLVLLLGAVGFVLLIATANLANLGLVRAAHRGRELSIRAALGAGRMRLVSQLLTESVTLALAGGAAGLVLAFGLLQALPAISPVVLPRMRDIRIDGQVLTFTLVASVLVGVVFGMIPAFRGAAKGVGNALKEGGRSQTAGAGASATRNALAVVEIALAMVLLVGAGLMLRSLHLLTAVRPGFDPDRVITMQVSLRGGKYRTPDQVLDFHREAIRRIRSAPGVIAAGAASCVPLTGCGSSTYLLVEGRPQPPNAAPPLTSHRAVTPDYFRALGIPIIQGRTFAEREPTDVVIVSAGLARKLWPDEDPIGKRIGLGRGEWREVIGVAGDVRNYGLEAPAGENTYLPSRQWPSLTSNMTYVVRTRGDAAKLAGLIRDQIRSIDRDVPVAKIRTMSQYVSGAASMKRFEAVLLAAFASLALLVTAVGIYSVLAYQVTQRTHEIGIRLALGADRGRVTRTVLRETALIVAAGTAIGVLGALALTRTIRALLFEVKPTDPATYGAVVIVFFAVSALASYVPARRVTKVDPVIALRYE